MQTHTYIFIKFRDTNATESYLTMQHATAHTNCASIHSPTVTKRPNTLRSNATTKSNAFSLTLIGASAALDDAKAPDVDTDNEVDEDGAANEDEEKAAADNELGQV